MKRFPGLTLLAALLATCAGVPGPVPPGVERIVFVGDSLVNVSEREHGLLSLVRERLQRRHPGAALDLVNAGVNGNCIADIRERLEKDVLALAPAAVVLYWDSDAADVEPADATPEQAAALRAAYERDLEAVLGALRGAAVHVVLAGPTLMGERPRGTNEKDAVLDAYEAINRRLAGEQHVRYVDTRRPAFRWLSHRRPGAADRGELTVDGEHLNEAGTRLVARQVAAALDPWLARRHAVAEGTIPPEELPADH